MSHRPKHLIGLSFLAIASQLAVAQTTPATTSPAVRAARQDLVDLLRYATSEMTLQDPAYGVTELLAIARDQAILKDLEGLTKTTARIQALIDKADADDAKRYNNEAAPSLAGTYAWAGQLEKAKTNAAKAPANMDAEDTATMHAQMGDFSKAEAILATVKPDARAGQYARVAKNLWLGDRLNAEKFLKKAADLDSKSSGSAAYGYARVGDFKTASTLAQAGKSQWAWESIAQNMEEFQEFELARLAKAGYLILNLQTPARLQSVTLVTTFQFQWELEDTQNATTTAARLVKEAKQDITENTLSWDSQITGSASAAQAAAQLGDDALVKSMLDAAAKIKVPAADRKDADEQLEGYAATGRARRLLATGKWKEALDMAQAIDSSIWQEEALNDLVKDALRRGEVETAIRIHAGMEDESVRHGDSAEWIARALARMYTLGTPLDGKPFNLPDWPRSLEEHEERAKAARAIVEELLRRGAVKP